MRLTDLDPRWLLKDNQRVGFVFRNPVKKDRGWWSSCFFKPTPDDVQEALIDAELGEDTPYQICNPDAGWTSSVDAEVASFETLTVTPSLDGGPGWWHGHITNGEIVGGLP